MFLTRTLVPAFLLFFCAAAPAAHDEIPAHSHASASRPGNVTHEAGKNASETGFSPEATLLWDSKYVSEGRDNLASGGLLSVALDIPLPAGFLFSAWHATGDSVRYQETNLSLAYGVEFGHLSAGLSYTYLSFRPDDEDDHELAAELVYTIHGLELGAAAVYSTEAEGTFFELATALPLELGSGIHLTPSLTLGINSGFVADEHDGLNDLRFALDLGIPLGDHLELLAYAAYSLPLEESSGETLENLFFGGLGLVLKL